MSEELTWIKNELQKEDIGLTEGGVRAILEYRTDKYEQSLVDLVWELHFEYVELSNVRLSGDDQGEVAASDA